MENCAATCPIVTEAVQASSKEGRIRMAIAAIEAEKISEREAARKFDVPRKTLNDRRRKQCDDGGRIRPTPTSEERQKWHQDKADGMNIAQIARKHGRDRGAVRNELKKELPKQVKPKAAEGLSVEIVAREKKLLPKQVKQIEGLILLSNTLEKHWKSDQKRLDKAGASVWKAYAKDAHEALISSGCLDECRQLLGLKETATYPEILEALDSFFSKGSVAMNWMLYLSGYRELPGGQL